MMEICCVSGCEKTNDNSNENFYTFPVDFDLCMLWIQTCGKAEYFEDFAYGGALPFVSRRICSKHFKSSDFVDPNDRALGVQAGVVPIAHFEATDVVIKTEISDDDVSFEQDFIMDSDDFYRNEDTLASLVRRNDNGSLLENTFRLTWSHALQNVENSVKNRMKKRPNETEKQRKARLEKQALRVAIKRANETKQEKQERMYKDAVRAALKRSLETEKQRSERKLKNALRAAYRRSMETPEQKAERRRKDMIRSAQRRKDETEMQAKIRRYNDSLRAAFKRKNLSEEEKKERREVDVVRAARRRSMETPQQREARLKADRERAARKRLLKKLNDIPHFSFIEEFQVNDGMTIKDEKFQIIKNSQVETWN